MLLPHSVVFKNQCACNTGPALTSVANIRYPAAMVGPASIPLRQRLREAANQIHLRTPLRPRIALLLSTGHGSIANQLKDKITVHQTDLPAGLHLTAPLLIGMLEGVPVALADAPLMPFGGGHADLLHPIQLMHALGSELLVLTAGAASLCQQIEAGTLAVVEDHLNFSGTQPLQGGGSDQLGPSFPDMCEAYPRRFLELTRAVAMGVGVPCLSGVFASVPGPSMPTRAEYRFLRRSGADLVGMSLVPEVIAAVQSGFQVLALVGVTQQILEDRPASTSIEAMLEAAELAAPRMASMIVGIVSQAEDLLT
ncbi:purine nucleoside phosphorylase [Planctomycetota bacterium]|nr:purine nucleoside phosphorylase [Planctomycetota bacterium]